MGRPSKILIQTIGSRGDVQPFIGLGQALQKAGMQVHFFTNKNYASMLEASNLTGDCVFYDTEKEHKENPSLMKAMGDGDVFSLAAAVDGMVKSKAEEHLIAWFACMERFKPDLVINGTASNGFGAIAERKMRIPCININLFCMPENPERMLMGVPNLPCGCNKFLVRYMYKDAMYPLLVNTYDEPCSRLYGFKPSELYTFDDFWASFQHPPFEVFVAVSSVVANVIDASPPANRIFCGYFPTESQMEIATAAPAATAAGKSGVFGSAATIEAIKSFMAAGSKPAYMGWGSMTHKSPEELVEMVARAAQIAGSRALLYQGWVSIDMDALRRATKDTALIEYAEQNLLFVGKTPHDWLFPQCSCIVHHGGSGTMATAARAGTPQVITPVIMDQFDHAYFMNTFGAGVGFEKKSLTKLSAKELGEAIKTCESSPRVKAKAAAWAEVMKSENACQRVVDHVEKFWSESVETGKYEQHVAARLAAIEQQRGSSSRCCG